MSIHWGGRGPGHTGRKQVLTRALVSQAWTPQLTGTVTQPTAYDFVKATGVSGWDDRFRSAETYGSVEMRVTVPVAPANSKNIRFGLHVSANATLGYTDTFQMEIATNAGGTTSVYQVFENTGFANLGLFSTADIYAVRRTGTLVEWIKYVGGNLSSATILGSQSDPYGTAVYASGVFPEVSATVFLNDVDVRA